MTIIFHNSCKYSVILNVNTESPIVLESNEKKAITQSDLSSIKVFIRRNCNSKKEASMYYLILGVEYIFSNVSDGEMFVITREKIQISLNTFYDRLFLAPTNACCSSSTYKIMGEKEIKRIYKKTLRSDSFFEMTLDLIGLIIILLLVGIVLLFAYGWKVAIIFCFIALLFVFALGCLINMVWKIVEKNIFKFPSEKEEFYNFFKNDFIENFYS